MDNSGEMPKRPTPKWEQTFNKWSQDPAFEPPLKDLGAPNFHPGLKKALVELVEWERRDETNPPYRKNLSALSEATGKAPQVLNNIIDNIRAINESEWKKPHVEEFER